MCKIQKNCLCGVLSEFMKDEKKTGLDLQALFQKQAQSVALDFLKLAMKIENTHDKTKIIQKSNTLATNFLYTKIPTQNGRFVLKLRDDSVCPDFQAVQKFAHFLVKINGNHQAKTLELNDLGELKNRLQDMVLSVQHSAFTSLLQDVSFASMIQKGSSGSESTADFRKEVRSIYRNQLEDKINDVLEQLNMDETSAPQENRKTGASISH